MGRSPLAALACLLIISYVIPVSCVSLGGLASPGMFKSQVLVVSESPIAVVRSSDAPSLVLTPSSDAPVVQSLDLFVFNDDAFRTLDSYQRYESPSSAVEIYSSGGDKIVVGVANLSQSLYNIYKVSSYDALEGMKVHLENEDPAHPVMTGESVLAAGGECSLRLEPLMARVELSSVSCDFAGKPYAGELLEHAKVYLTNVSGTSELLRTSGFAPANILNMGALSDMDMSRLQAPCLLCNELHTGLGRSGTAVGAERQDVGVVMHAYPNEAEEESIGSPFTRLVLEGEIGGEKTYYPLNINRPGFGYVKGRQGLSRNVRYVFDLAITRKGTSDPDTPITPGEVETTGWIELHPGNVLWGRDGEQLHIWVEMYPEETDLDICRDDLDYDVERGIYSYEMDPDGHGVVLDLLKGGTGMFTIDAGPPVNAGFLVIVIVNP